MKKILTILFIILALVSCGGGNKQDESKANEVNVAIDETFRPIMEAEFEVFNAKQPEAIINASYLPETDAINLMLKDSVRTIIATRKLSAKEEQQIFDVYKLQVQSKIIAYDAIALIINKANNDSLLSVNELKSIMTGNITQWNQIQNATTKGEIEVVFDNENSSTVRYVRDSICEGKQLKGNFKGGKTNQDVIKYVSQTRNAIGIIGVDWLRNQADSTNLTFNPNIRVMSISRSSVTEEGNSYQPVQYYIATGDYPLVRSVYSITTDPRERSMERNFFYFLSDQQGQLIITKSSQLLPNLPVQVKQVDNSF